MTKSFSDLRAKMSPEALGRVESKAQALPDNCTTIQLTLEGQQMFSELMAAPPEPTEAMKALGALENFEEITEA